jgi:putative spermidine/putrescine transport system substrate-binding protein
MLSPDVKGAVGLTNTPQVGVMDVAMAAEAAGLMSFKDKGDMTKAEIDQLMNSLITKKKEGHFRAFWETFGQSVNLMVSGEVLIESMWSPAVTAVRAEGINCIYATLEEGYRGWHAGITISAKTTGKALDLSYEYLKCTSPTFQPPIQIFIGKIQRFACSLS